MPTEYGQFSRRLIANSNSLSAVYGAVVCLLATTATFSVGIAVIWIWG